MHRYKYSLIGLLIAVAFFLAAIAFDLDLTEAALGWLNSMEQYELDELLLAAIPLFIGFAFDFRRITNERRKAQLKLATLRSTMNTVDHVINNAHQIVSNNVTSAEEQGLLDPTYASKIQEVISLAQIELDKLRSVNSVKEKEIMPGFSLVDLEDRDNK